VEQEAEQLDAVDEPRSGPREVRSGIDRHNALGLEGRQQALINASPQACFDAITDYETFPDWQDAVDEVEVMSRYPDGLGREVHFLLRAASLPGSEFVLPVLAASGVHRAGDAVGGFMRRLGLRAGADLDEMWRGFTSLGDAGARHAFIHTLRGLIEPGGQRVNATDRLYLAQRMPTMLIWGERDPIIPIRHGRAASEMIPDARFEVFPDARHFPHRDEPRRFVKVLSEFIETTEPAHVTDADFKDLLRREG